MTSTKTCYMCEKVGTTTEHVPPKCFFPESKDLPHRGNLRKNLITVPACEEHNTKKATDDEYLLAVVAAHFENNGVAKNHYLSKVARALRRSHGFGNLIAAKAKRHGQCRLKVELDVKRFDRGMEMIARALYYAEVGDRLLQPIRVHSPSITVNEKADAYVGRFGEYLRHLMADSPTQGNNPEVFEYQLKRCNEDEKSVVVLRMVFYEGFEVFALSADSFEA